MQYYHQMQLPPGSLTSRLRPLHPNCRRSFATDLTNVMPYSELHGPHAMHASAAMPGNEHVQFKSGHEVFGQGNGAYLNTH